MTNTPETSWFSSNVLSFYWEEGETFMNLALCHKVGEQRTPVYVTLVAPLKTVPSRGQSLATEGHQVSEDALQADVGGQLFDLGSFKVSVTITKIGFATGQLTLTAEAGQRVTIDFSAVPALYLELPSYSGATMPDGDPQAPPPVSLRILP